MSLCDILMPHHPGDRFYLTVSKIKPYLRERFLFITAHEGAPKTGRFLQYVDALVPFKPVRVGDLLRTITLALAQNLNRSDFRPGLG